MVQQQNTIDRSKVRMKFSVNMLPMLTKNDLVNDSPINRIVLCESHNRLTSNVSSMHLSHLIISYLGSPISRANDIRSMLFAIVQVSGLCVVPKIVAEIVRRIVVFMTNNMTIWNRTTKCLVYQAVNQSPMTNSVQKQNAPSIRTLFNNFKFSQSTATNVFGISSLDGSNMSAVGDFVKIFKSNNRTPFFVYNDRSHDVNLHERFACGKSRFSVNDAGSARVVLTQAA